MRFLVFGQRKHLISPEMLPSILDGAIDWVNRYKAEGKIESAFLDAGRQASCFLFH